MNLFYCKNPTGNFGDDMNLWFWDKLMPGWQEHLPETTLFGIGTILTKDALRDNPKAVICGSGTGYGDISSLKSPDTQVAWVRGPNTAKMLGVDPKLAITDPACMVAEMAPFAGSKAPSGKTLFIPHRLTSLLEIDWDRIGDELGVSVVSPQLDAVEVITEIMNADLVLAESMHAAIIADALRVPWIAVEISHHFNAFKWNDWAQSVEADLTVHPALARPKAAYFFLRRNMGAVKSFFKTRPTPKADAAPAAAQGQVKQFSNPNYMQKDERDFVKKSIARFAPVFENLLIRDLKTTLTFEPSLSPEGVVQARRDRIKEVAAKVMAGKK